LWFAWEKEMTLHQITFFFLGILLVVVVAMFVHSWLDKRRVFKALLPLAGQFPGRLIQESVWVYPRFEGKAGERAFDFFFTVVKAGRQHVLYAVYSLKSSVTSDLLLVKTDLYKPIADEAGWSERAGAAILDFHDAGYQARSKSAEAVRSFFPRLSELLGSLSDFASLQLGPDAVVAGKPYGGLEDVSPQQIGRNVAALQQLAEAMER
jgi:hypothetical protein